MTFHPPAGQASIAAHAFVGGDPATPVSSVAVRTFDVEQPGEPLSDRIAQDYRDGVITADDAAIYSMRSAIDPDYLAHPHVELYDDNIPDDPQALAVFAATLFDEVSEQTLDELQDLLTGDDAAGGTAASLYGAGLLAAPIALPLAATAADFPECSVIGACRTTATLDDGGTTLDLQIAYRFGDGAGQVPAVDDDGNQRADTINRLIANVDQAWRLYDSTLGLRAPNGQLNIVLLGVPGGVFGAHTAVR